ncbi:hypothetical protein SPSIL_044320 [Sporomusa silvacetica DSM 10669]|uniref:NADPH-dependent FMN reductase-like domain-containing protein n=1 Tax=Sporomusa silvacetica DSM 10669 TaxID=1123289 RepID=A0ABZ3IRA2_9FIRM|nr:flavodoxin family protein [Sporomusa silvacetica]OZC20693.1 iron-sulfur flavoprotein [Sporomusa silvacetica DSM 10669]
MKIVAINGSPKGKASNTNVMVSAFLKGAQEAGAEIVNVFLAEKEIKHCKGCISCWTNTPGQCVIKDDMAEILAVKEGADILVLATPLYYDHISSMLKVFMDRMIVTVAPHVQKYSNGECRHVNKDNDASPFRSGVKPPKLVMISNCGYPERSHFQVISLWIERLALNMLTEVIGEIYIPQGPFLNLPAEALQPLTASCPQLVDNIANYLQLLEKAGKEIATDSMLSV